MPVSWRGCAVEIQIHTCPCSRHLYFTSELLGRACTAAGALTRTKGLHQEWVQQNGGAPQNEEQRTQWFQWLKQKNFDDDLIRQLYQEITSPPKDKKPKKKEMCICRRPGAT
ncbi:unnamed protein product [Polarella glacialis]|uniref:Uncharacterized protein n=1 Tax=Polarella glacialis TaxID=89957 RepID=A0A813EXK5_POLGL|nr:unnamed protein product [Polarella glacialis]